MLKLEKILCPVDFSDFTETAVRTAAEYASRFGAELRLVHVFEEPLYPADMGFGVASSGPEGVPNELTEQLQTIGDKLVPDGVAWSATIQVGPSPYVAICGYAEQEGIDLIILPTHGRTGLAHMFIGSTAERVVRRAPCPVLVLRADAQPAK